MRTIYTLAAAALCLSACQSNPDSAIVKSENISEVRRLEGEELVKRGNYLVSIASCGECHSPKNMGPMGPVVDSSRMLSGHPANMQLPPADPNSFKPGGWYGMSPDLTAFAGPWGMSFSANLTPDSATGIGAWTEQNFIATIRTGRHLGLEGGRQILPPMPLEYVRNMTDEDLRSIFAYLKTLPPVSNRVPNPVPPNVAAAKP